MVKAFLVEADPASVYISVVDTGQGISPESKALIFERMYQDPNAVDNSRKGLGLGLYIVQELVRLHGGRIWVESQLSHGSTFSFTLPLFSLAKLLFPVITDQGHLRDALTLVVVALIPRGTPEMGNWERTHEQCLTLLRGCILPAKDLILPALAASDQAESFVIVASTDANGAEVLTKRIAEQLERAPELCARTSFTVSAIPIKLPCSDSGQPVEKLVHEVADVVTTMAAQALRERPDGRNEPTVWP